MKPKAISRVYPPQCNQEAAMPEIDATDQPVQKPYPAEKARGGEIVLNTKLSKAVFIAGLFGGLVVVIALALYLGIVG
jgi:hypothetical protein